MALAITLSVLLSSCSTPVKKDGPPSYFVDVSKIQNAVPKIEPRAKYGNMTSYVVFGKRYHTLPSSSHYVATGTASWYGTKFHERRTSSGERYDMLGMTAAHKTLPLPTYVEVTNLSNGRKIIVKVNDRGPFEGSRLIDLSYAAAKKLDMLGHGTANVRIAAIDPETYGTSFASKRSARHYAHKTHPSKTLSHTLYLQVGAFKEKARALNLKHHLSGVLSSPIQIVNRDRRFYRVQVGPIQDVATEHAITHQLKGLGIHAKKRYASASR
ncbi:MAG: hypothetical protein A3F14_05125 [Gammaproteobacteria bacterium RIFCSPHIGHO2_12_FULL_43_28]|nr:MAG: hypothetical protein A3F14_05125 [Gammaproteobacteria bacterium RIFCSPHIGHO2_12_FULL_43_28]